MTDYPNREILEYNFTINVEKEKGAKFAVQLLLTRIVECIF